MEEMEKNKEEAKLIDEERKIVFKQNEMEFREIRLNEKIEKMEKHGDKCQDIIDFFLDLTEVYFYYIIFN